MIYISKMSASLSSFSASEIERLMRKGIEDDTTVVNVSVAIWFTKEFAEVEDDIQGQVDTEN